MHGVAEYYNEVLRLIVHDNVYIFLTRPWMHAVAIYDYIMVPFS